MGLDMYLNKRTYIGANYEHMNVKGEINITAGNNDKKINIKLKRVVHITEEIAYWRKSNHIHAWFVKNVQGDEDDCGEYPVSANHLKQLLAVLKAALANKKQAGLLAPTASGFFFGSTEYYECYFEETERTIKIIEEILKDVDDRGCLNGDYFYNASW